MITDSDDDDWQPERDNVEYDSTFEEICFLSEPHLFIIIMIIIIIIIYL
jgi:hypothetical protein